MTDQKVETVRAKWPLDYATKIAEELKTMLEPTCERIQIAGSIRRKKPFVGDIELLCIPKVDAFGSAHLIDCSLAELCAQDVLALRLNKRGQHTYGPKNKLLVHPASGINVDLFTADAQNWGMALMVRTGPKECNIMMMTRFRSLGMQGHAYGGVTNAQGREIDCPNEETVYWLLGWGWVPPEERR